MTDTVRLDDLVEDENDRAWLDGRPFTGEATESYSNGVIASVTAYVDGYEKGLQRIWRNDGTLESEAVLEGGNAVGNAYRWHPSGTLAEEVVFDDRGHPRTRRAWDEEGNLVDEYSWEHVYGTAAVSEERARRS